MTDELRLQDIRTEAVEDFLKTVYLLQRQVDPVPTTLLAQALNIKAPSVTDMIRRLAGVEDDREKKNKPDRTSDAQGDDHTFKPLLKYEKYRGVQLTELGEKIALEVIRHHRLLELYLSQALGYSWDEVHAEADRLEHHISEQLESRIAEVLGNPAIDPHGDPIPALDGTISTRELTLLSELAVGQHGIISRIIDQTPEVLRYFSDLGMVPGIKIQMAARAPLGDTISLTVGDEMHPHTLSMQVARKVMVDTAP